MIELLNRGASAPLTDEDRAIVMRSRDVHIATCQMRACDRADADRMLMLVNSKIESDDLAEKKAKETDRGHRRGNGPV